MSATVIEVSREDRAAIKRATKLKGSLRDMVQGAKISRRAIENARDLGRCQSDTLAKIKAYLDSKNPQT